MIIVKPWHRVIEIMLSYERDFIVLRLTLLLLLLYGSSTWMLDVPLRIICGLMLIWTFLTKNRISWLLICAIVVWGNALEWFWIDNHKYLITYWTIACTLAVASSSCDDVLSHNARILIGLTFLFATLWKLLGGEYLSGAFLHYTLLTDSRAEALASLIGGLSPDTLPHNRRLEETLKALSMDGLRVQLSSSLRLQAFALFASYWTLFIEGALAYAFLTRPRLMANGRDYVLMVFTMSTYFIFPVTGFAFALATLGFAQCEVERVRTRAAYLLLLLAVELTRVPWKNFVLAAFTVGHSGQVLGVDV